MSIDTTRPVLLHNFTYRTISIQSRLLGNCCNLRNNLSTICIALSILVVLFTMQGLRMYPIHRQQTIMISNVSGKEKEQGMLQCLRKRRMQKNLRRREAHKKKTVLDNMLFVSFPFCFLPVLGLELFNSCSCMEVTAQWR